MIQNILETYWDNWEEDYHPTDRRMTIIDKTIGEPSMSVENTRFLINEIVRRMGGVYLEVGVFAGHSLMSAAVHNPHVHCIGIENFTEHPDKTRLEYNIKHHIPSNAVVLNGSYEDLLPKMTDYAEEITVYYYDGHHSFKDTLLGLYMVQPLMAPKSYILLDDLVMNQVRHAKNRFVNANDSWKEVFCVVPPKELVTKKTYRNWYNGFCVLERV